MEKDSQVDGSNKAKKIHSLVDCSNGVMEEDTV